jgi:hypothetical protein
VRIVGEIFVFYKGSVVFQLSIEFINSQSECSFHIFLMGMIAVNDGRCNLLW